jgi:hypothetical protein
LSGWFIGASFAQPYYYSYGTGGNVYYQNNQVYMDGQVYVTAPEYYE